MLYLENYTSPVGDILLGSDGRALTGLWIERQKNDSRTLQEAESCHLKHVPVFDETKAWLDCYFQGQAPDFLPPLAFHEGSPFRQEIWKLLLEIPFGEVITYGGLARRMAEKMGKASMSAQAVGGAVGHNPVSIIVPCHRVVGAGGNLTGYGGGIDIKEKLLEIEHWDLSLFHRPKHMPERMRPAK